MGILKDNNIRSLFSLHYDEKEIQLKYTNYHVWIKKPQATKQKNKTKQNSSSCGQWGGQSAEKVLSASAKWKLKQNWMGQWKQLCSTTAYSPQLPVWAKNWDMRESAHQLGRTLKQEPHKLQLHRKNLNNNQHGTVQQKKDFFFFQKKLNIKEARN